MSLANYIPEYLAFNKHWRPSSIVRYKTWLTALFNFFGEEEPNTMLVEKYINHSLAAGGLPEDTIRAGKRFFIWLEEMGYATMFRWPTRKFPPRPRKELVWDEEDLEALLLAASDYRRLKIEPFWTDAIQIAWDTGLRKSDVSTMKWTSVDFEKRMIRLLPMKTQKFGRYVEIPMGPDLLRVMEDLLDRRHSEYVLPDMADWYLVPDRWTSFHFHKLAKAAGVQGSFHTFRHTFVTRWLAKGLSPAIMMTISGHSLEELSTYCHVTIDQKHKAMFPEYEKQP